MKKIFVFILCVMLLMAFPVVALAEGENTPEGENVPPVEEIVTEGEISASEASITETIVDYVKDNLEEILVVALMALYSFYEARIRGKMTGSIGLLNNNAITIAQNSAETIKTAFEKIEAIRDKVNGFEQKIELLLEEFRTTAEEKQSFEDTLNQFQTFLKTAKMANLELSNEVAELLVLSNIPNSVKEELTARHYKAVHDLEAAEEGVITNDGEKA